MKIQSKIVLLLILAMSTSCEDFLREEPPTFISATNYWQTASDARTAVDGVYKKMNDVHARFWGGIDAYTDDQVSRSRGSWYNDFGMHVLTPSNRLFEQFTVYRDWWIGIGRANNVIKFVPEIDMDEAEKNMVLGEARALRAFYYYQLVRAFGDMPLITDVVDDTDFSVPRNSADEIYNQIIIPDLQFAEEHCRDDLHDGHITKWTAKLLLSEVYLTLAGWRMTSQGKKVQGDASNWALAKDKAKEVVDNSPHTLNTNYSMAWEDAAPFTAESMLELSYVQVLGFGNWMSRESNGAGTGINYWGANDDAPLVDEGISSTVSELRPRGRVPGTGVYLPTPDLWDEFEDGDTRKWSLATRIDGDDGTVVLVQPTFRKFIDKALYLGEEGTSFQYTNSNLILYRYADALLIYAEAQNEADGSPNAAAYDAINALRTRAGLPDLTPGLSQTAFREAVWHERRVELNAEFKRKFDLIRTNRLLAETTDINLDWTAKQGARIDYVNAYTAYYNARPAWPDHEWLWPIPQSEMDLNIENGWVQNAGY